MYVGGDLKIVWAKILNFERRCEKKGSNLYETGTSGLEKFKTNCTAPNGRQSRAVKHPNAPEKESKSVPRAMAHSKPCKSHMK